MSEKKVALWPNDKRTTENNWPHMQGRVTNVATGEVEYINLYLDKSPESEVFYQYAVRSMDQAKSSGQKVMPVLSGSIKPGKNAEKSDAPKQEPISQF